MPDFTPNFNLSKPTQMESYDIGVPNANMDIIDTQLKVVSDKVERYGIATGTNNLVLNLINAPTSLYPGLTVRFKNTVANTGNVTLNINGLGNVPLIRNGGRQISIGGLKTNGVYTVTYDGTNFTLQGEGGEYGTAVASEVLAGKTIGTENGIVTGTMPNRGTFNLGLGVTVPAGYYSGGTTASGANFASGTTKTSADGFLIVSGLSFTSSRIIARQTGSEMNYYSVYDVSASSHDVFLWTYSTGSYVNLSPNGYVNSTGFKIHVPNGNINFTWIAYA